MFFDIIETGDNMNPFSYKNKRKQNYFEGYYLKITDDATHVSYAFIFGISKAIEDPHSFIQFLDGNNHTAFYYRFLDTDFKYMNDTIYIKDNFVSMNQMFVSVDDIQISINITNQVVLEKQGFTNSAMGFLHKLPMECFQEVVFMDGSFHGELTIHQKTSMISGKPYMEKTFGHKFPEKWIWMQCNFFNKEAAFSLSLGEVKLFRKKFVGFIIILIHNKKQYRFTTYNFSRLKLIRVFHEDVEIEVKKGKYRLVIQGKLVRPVQLVGPVEKGKMSLDVFESINSYVTLQLRHKKNIVFETIGRFVGMENMYED